MIRRAEAITWWHRAQAWERSGGKCFYCHKPLDPSVTMYEDADRVVHIDHMIPKSRGGTSTIDNLVVSCMSCNSAKGDRTPEEWLGTLEASVPASEQKAQDTWQGIPHERRYLRPSEVVRVTGISRTSVFEALWSGDLEGYRRGRAWLIPVEAVDRWIRGDEP